MALDSMGLMQPITIPVDISSGLVTLPMRTQLMKGDRNANRVLVEIKDGNEKPDLTGIVVTGSFIRPPDSAEVPLDGTAEGNVASVILSDACYTQQGYCEIHVKLTAGETARTILTLTGYVREKGSGVYVDVEGVIPSIDDIIAQYDEMRRVTQLTIEAAEYAKSLAIDASGYAANTGSLGGIPASSYLLRSDAQENYLMRNSAVRSLVVNGDFAKPVNRRGKVIYPFGSVKGTIDGWVTKNRVEIADGHITAANESEETCDMIQRLDAGTIKAETAYTMVMQLESGKICMGSGAIADSDSVQVYADAVLSMGFGRNHADNGKDYVQIGIAAGSSVGIKWIDLYEGEYTEVTRPPHVPNGYAEELSACRLLEPDLDKITIYPLVSKKTQDCILIQAYGENILCDGGTVSVEEDPDAPAVLVGKLKALGADRLDKIIISHYHNDHTGVHEMIAYGLNVKGAQLILPQNIPEGAKNEISGAYNQQTAIQTMAEDQKMEIIHPEENDKIQIGGEGAYLEFFNTDHDLYYASVDEAFDYNNCSLCTLLVHGEKKVFFSGDLALEGQKTLIGKLPKVDLYKTEHHGLNSWIDKEYYMTLTPAMALTSNGNEEEAARRTYAHMFAESAAQIFYQANGIPNFATCNNENLMFVVARDSIEVYGKSFNTRVTIEGYPSLMSAIPYDYQGTSKDITLMDLIKCMERESYVTTRISSSYALWDLVGNFVDNTCSHAMITVFKSSSQGYTGSLTEYTGYIQIIPMPKDSLSGLPMTGMIVGTYKVNPDATSLSVDLRQLVPAAYHKFTNDTSVATGAFSASGYNGDLYTRDTSGYIKANFAGVIKYSMTVINKSGKDNTLSICRKTAAGTKSTIVSALLCKAGETLCVTNMYDHGVGDVFFVEQSNDDFNGLLIWIICEGVIDGMKHLEFTDTSMTATPLFTNHKYY